MIVGIDLGTTHSLIGYYGPEGPVLIPNALGDFLTPSVVGLDVQERVLVGSAARDRLSTHPGSATAAFKRYMGAERTITLGRKAFRPEELSALVLRQLVEDAESHLGEPVTEAVISVPAYFSDSQRKATRVAGELAGLKVERLINEPTAAALAYGLQERKDNSTFLVFDLGGGTFDVSILEAFDGVMQVHATAGDNYLGGEDFVTELVRDFCEANQLRLSDLAPREQAQLAARMERAKQQLSSQAEATVEMRIGDKDVSWKVDETRFARLVEPLVQRLRQPIERALRDARIDPTRLDEVVLVGGASRMPLVSRLAARMLGKLPLRHINPDQAIALGAAVAAGMKARNQSLEEIVLTDVCPYTLGIATSRGEEGRRTSGHFSPLIERNSTVPVSRVERFWPAQDWQTDLKLEVFQGESPRVANNVRLGELTLPLPRKKAEDNPVDVRFTYDINGVLQVEALVVAAGTRHELILQNSPGAMSPEEIRERLKSLSALKVHPRDQQPNIAIIARLERLYEEHIGNARQMLQDWLARFMATLESQDLKLIEQHRQELGEALDQFESQVR
ncbi:Hsp70 family protein [Arenimonas sp. MALMAid1274]|uniref:Hsp70 family protein n=1 Tax=Arenimonas sp. MALMAid1274 TaxID=3411630 RepID=UPI003BA3A6A6